MQIDSIQKFNFKSTQTSKMPTSQISQLKKVIDKQGYNSKPVYLGAIAGFILGASAGIMQHKKITGALVDAMCLSGLGIVAGRIINLIQNKRTTKSNV